MRKIKDIFEILMNKNFFWFLNDKIYIKLKYKLLINKKLDLNNPQTFNEKLQWLKLNDRKDLYTELVDKYCVRHYVSDNIGEQHVIPLLGVYESFDDINFCALPEKFVIKCTHDSGGLVICENRETFDIIKAKKKINKYMKRNFYMVHREWPYKNVKPRIIIEQYMKDSLDNELRDYKFYCFNGKCDYVMLCCGRNKVGGAKFYYLNTKWELQREMSVDGMEAPKNIFIRKPNGLDKMFDIARKLSKDIPFVRVDLYNVNGEIFFGEMTFFPSAGFDNTRPKITEDYLNKNLKIKEEK